MTDFPIEEVIPQVKQHLHAHRTLVLQAPPGAGKSTVLPLRLLNESWLQDRKILMLEPRRLAARSVALRLAQQLGEEPGETVGYRIRFESVISPRTRLEVVTEGILTRMLQADNTLDEYGLLIFDEFHERSIHTDLSLALSLQVQRVVREELRLLIMSATIDAASIAERLQAPLVVSSGRQHPVEIRYWSEASDLALPKRVARAIRQIWDETKGDLLVFLPGAGEIQRTHELLSEAGYPAIHPLFGDLPFREQQAAIQPNPNGVRKIVLSTSLAETSLTIEGVGVVVDAGLARVPRFDPRSGLARLETIPVTKDSADQRAGRAGRLGPGICYRLWSAASHQHLLAERKPEILEADLAPLLLELLNWGARDAAELFWMTPPPTGPLQQAMELLTSLEAVDQQRITAKGRAMAALPNHPRLTHMIMEAQQQKDKSVLALTTDLLAVLEERDPLGRESGADVGVRIDALRKWRQSERVAGDRVAWQRVEKVAAQWRRWLAVVPDSKAVDDFAVGQLISWAYPDRIARQIDPQGSRYKLSNGRVARLPEQDQLSRNTWLAVAEADLGSGEGRIFSAAPLDQALVLHSSAVRQELRWDENAGRILSLEIRSLGALVVQQQARPLANPDAVIPVWGELIRDRGLNFLQWSDEIARWRQRVMSVCQWRPQDGWPDLSDGGLLSRWADWAGPFLGGITSKSELLKLNWLEILQTQLDWSQQQQLDRLAPARLEVPSGSKIIVDYFADGRSPVMEVRLQELFGMAETPTLNEGRIRITMHLLSPGYKPVQVTQDLKNFWNTTYYEVRKELRMRYPKHSWPDDPWTAQAVRGAKRRTSS
jgi:ATP-dependent helicase HrpB